MSSLTSFLTSTTYSTIVPTSHETGLPTVTEVATNNTSTSLTVPTLIPNPNSTTTYVPPFIHHYASTSTHSNPVYVVVPVVIGIVCIVGLVGICSFMRWKRRNSPKSNEWWSKSVEGYGTPVDQGRDTNHDLYTTKNTVDDVKHVDSWRKSAPVAVKVEELADRNEDAKSGALDDEESLKMLVMATNNGTIKTDEYRKEDAGSDDGEATDLLLPERMAARENTSTRDGRRTRKESTGTNVLVEDYQGAFVSASRQEFEVAAGLSPVYR